MAMQDMLWRVDPKAISDAIIDFYESEKESEFVREVIKNKKRFSWDSMANGIKRLANYEVEEKSTLA